MNTEAILKRFENAKKARSNWIPVWEECYEYALPLRESFFGQEAGADRMDKIFDETAVTGVQEFASRLQYGLIPNFANWFRFEAGSDIPADQRQELQAELDEVTEAVAEVIRNSNFSQEASESFLDLAVGTGNMLIEEGDEVNPVKFTAVPLSQVMLDRGPYGEIDGVFRERQVKARDVQVLWPKAKISTELRDTIQKEPDKDLVFIDCIYRDYLDKKGEVYIYNVIEISTKTEIATAKLSGEGAKPWVNFRWSKAASETYGRGPLMNALPAIKVANLTVQLILENAQFAIGGIWQMDDDGSMNVDTIELVPGTILSVDPNSRGLQGVQSPSRFDVSQLVLDSMRENIKKALFNEDFGPMDKTPMSATEVSARQGSLAQVIGSAYGRLLTEFVNPVVMRVVHIMKKRGMIELPRVNGREIRIVAKSPLARAQRSQDILQLTNFIGMVTNTMGPQAAAQYINPSKAVEQLAQWYEIPQKLLVSDEERESNQRRMGENLAQAEANQQGGAAQMAEAMQKLMP